MSVEHGKRVLEIEARAIANLVDRLDHRFSQAVDVLFACTGKVVVSGMGKSGLIGQKIAATLASTGTPAFFLHPAEGIHGDLGMLARHDTMIALSNSGETEEVLKLLPFVKRLNIPVIALTGKALSTLAKNCDVLLDVSVSEEACPMGFGANRQHHRHISHGRCVGHRTASEEGIERRRLCAISSRRRVGTASLAESQGPDASRSGHPARGSNGHGP